MSGTFRTAKNKKDVYITDLVLVCPVGPSEAVLDI